MENKNIMAEVVSTVSEAPIIIRVDVVPQNLVHELLIKTRILPKSRNYKVKPPYLGTMLRISQKVVQMPNINFDTEEDLSKAHEVAANHIDDFCYIIASAIQNNRKEPKEYLIKQIKDEFTATELFNTAIYLVKSLNLSAFTSSILLVQGNLNILRTQY